MFYILGHLWGEFHVKTNKQNTNTEPQIKSPVSQLVNADVNSRVTVLHWLPVTFRVQFKLLLLVYKSLRNQSPPYIKDLLSLKPATNYALRTSAQCLLFVPKANCSSLGDRVFVHAAPVLWNSLPLTIRTSSSLAIFKKQLKTFLFTKAFSLFQ